MKTRLNSRLKKSQRLIGKIHISHYIEPISEELDSKIRRLFLLCFENSTNLTKRRYNNEMPSERWIAYYNGDIIGHLAVHHKFITDINSHRFSFIGIAEVCLVPLFRGFGLVGELLKMAEDVHKNKDFSILFGESSVYERYGYRNVSNVIFPDIHNEISHLMMKCLSNQTWPIESLQIKGKYF